MTPLWIALAGGLGTSLRFWTDRLIRSIFGRRFPLSTIVINGLGAFCLGVVSGLLIRHLIHQEIGLIFGTGLCAGFTTFSTASFESVRLIQEKRYKAAAIQISSNFGISLIAVNLGLIIAELL